VGNIFEQDFQEFLQAFNDHKVEYLLVGGYAVILHGYFRSTGDLDVWVKPTAENYKKLAKAFYQFGLPIAIIPKHKFLDTEKYDVFAFGRAPLAIDIMTSVKGLIFSECYERRITQKVDNIEITLLSSSDLEMAKKEAGRLKDLNDIEHLKKKGTKDENG